MKKLLALLLALCLLCSAVSAALPFDDVEADDWYHDAVEYVYEQQLFNGTSATGFSPNGSMTRAMLVTVLHRLAGLPEADGSVPFTDLTPNTWYTDAVAWAYENEVVNGTTDTTFSPARSVTREQMVTILYRYALSCGYDCSNSSNLYAYSDRNTVSSYARDAFAWAVGSGIINGTTASTLGPAGTATRAQVATIIMRFVYVFDDDASNDPVVPEDPDEPVATPTIPYAPGPDSIEVGGCSYRIGMTAAQLQGQIGTPDETILSRNGYTWHIYGTDTYENFFMVGMYNGSAVALCGAGSGFSFMGKQMGDPAFSIDGSSVGCNVRVMDDSNDNNIIHSVLIEDRDFDSARSTSAQAMANEAKVNFHLVNAFRAYHGRQLLQWCPKAATSARLHSEDMANNDYFSHTGLNGSAPSERMSAQGIQWASCAENIAAGHWDAVEVHDGWINSAGHRSNMLGSGYTHLGVGAAYTSGGYRFYFTQNFYSTW